MKLQDIMTTHVATVAPENTVLDASKVMQIHNVGSVPVCDPNGKVLGIVTDRDIVVRNIANDGDPKTTRVEDMMTRDVIFGAPSMDADEAARLMAQNQIRRLPVVQNDRLVGIVAIGDLATRFQLSDEAGQVLSNISEPSRPENMMH
jgi:CBS domain-containing protein